MKKRNRVEIELREALQNLLGFRALKCQFRVVGGAIRHRTFPDACPANHS
jgi:hypothetical protein